MQHGTLFHDFWNPHVIQGINPLTFKKWRIQHDWQCKQLNCSFDGKEHQKHCQMEHKTKSHLFLGYQLTSMICSSESSLMMFSSTPTSPNSFSMMANFIPWSGDSKMWFSNVVLPEPRNPVSTVTGTTFDMKPCQGEHWEHDGILEALPGPPYLSKQSKKKTVEWTTRQLQFHMQFIMVLFICFGICPNSSLLVSHFPIKIRSGIQTFPTPDNVYAPFASKLTISSFVQESQLKQKNAFAQIIRQSPITVTHSWIMNNSTNHLYFRLVHFAVTIARMNFSTLAHRNHIIVLSKFVVYNPFRVEKPRTKCFGINLKTKRGMSINQMFGMLILTWTNWTHDAYTTDTSCFSPNNVMLGFLTAILRCPRWCCMECPPVLTLIVPLLGGVSTFARVLTLIVPLLGWCVRLPEGLGSHCAPSGILCPASRTS